MVLMDLVVRTWRIQWMVRGLGYRLSFRDAFTANAFGDAACAITPLRLGGEPARLGGLLRGGVPATAAFVAISYEVLAAWPVITVVAILLLWHHGVQLVAPGRRPTWTRAAARAWPWLAAVVLLTLAVGWWVRRRMPSAASHLKRPLKRTLVHWRKMPAWPLLASIPLTFANVVLRVGILPVLALTLPDPPPLAALLLGSFALLVQPADPAHPLGSRCRGTGVSGRCGR